RGYLDDITAIGPRTVGSPENEIHTVNYLLEQIKAIKVESTDAHKIFIDIQRPTGSFSIDFLGGFTSYYANITNVVVKLEPRSGAEHAVLSNCHFDSVPNTPGRLFFLLWSLLQFSICCKPYCSTDFFKVPQHAVIFLFNGAEENILQASHGFITQHEWAKSIRAFINLEAAGVGGKELVFQTGPENPWLVQAYIFAAEHPFASVVAQEIFQSGIIPADTDFRIYRDFGNIPGIDMAFIENGYIYHTEYDTSDRILTDSIQRAGDNILAVLKYLATSDKLAKSFEYRHGRVVFFDILGLFVLAYPARVGTIMNYMILAIAALYLSKKVFQPKTRAISNLKKFSTAFGLTLLSWISALVTVLIVAVFISLIGRSLSWYTHFYVSFSLYGTAAIAKLILVHTLAKKFFYKNMNEQYLGDVFFDASLMIWSIALAVLTQIGLCSAFICTLWVAFPLITKLMIHKEFRQRGVTMRFVMMYMLGMFVPYLYVMYLSWTVFEMFTPIMGRSGSEIPPDVALAGLIVAITMILSSYFINFIYLVKSTKTTLITLTAVFVITLLLVCSGIFFPYSSDSANPKPKRVFLQHTSRRFHDLDGNLVKSDSGIWINGFDYNGISHITPHVPEINDTIRTQCEERAPFCGFPWILPVHFMFRFVKNWYLPAPEILPSSPVGFKVLAKELMPWNSVRISFEVSGPSHMSLYIRPHKGSTLSSWSLGDGTPIASVGGDYFVFYSHGLQAAPWHFWIELTASEKGTDGIVSLAIAAHYFFGENQKSPQLYALLERLPNWTFSSGWSCTYDLFVF
ncbi:Endoplasmic reticulum metallopeptidase 1, partial [Struthio camelus australis]